DALKTRLYTNITHEFRTPLTVILGNLEMMKLEIETVLSDLPISQFLISKISITRRNSKNLLRLINQMLDLSKLDAGTMKLDVVRGDIVNYLQYLTESFHSMAQEKKIHLAFYAEIPELVMDFDEAKIQHVIYNLLSNALKFTGEGGKVKLDIEILGYSGVQPISQYPNIPISQYPNIPISQYPNISISISDTGIGIPAGQLERIFDRFYQIDSTHTRKGEGTGIGLALTKELVELMGGSISVQSEPGRGSVFTLLLPVRQEAGTPQAKTEFQTARTAVPELSPELPAAHFEGSENAVPDSEKPLLLIIEDNADVVTYIVGILEKDYDIRTAPNGQAGIEKALELVPDIIISDVMMPKKDGYEVCETLKTDERTSHIPIILLTAKAAEADRITGLRKGADAYLMKPFNKEELQVRLEKLVELRRVLQLRYAGSASADSTQSAVSTEPTLEDIFLKKIRQAIEAKMDDAELGIPDL
ncbi:MAG: ATP-binding protein, partial [Bacteroidota bacterium]